MSNPGTPQQQQAPGVYDQMMQKLRQAAQVTPSPDAASPQAEAVEQAPSGTTPPAEPIGEALPAKPTPSAPSLGEKLMGGVKAAAKAVGSALTDPNTYKGLAAGAARVPGQAVGAAIDTVRDVKEGIENVEWKALDAIDPFGKQVGAQLIAARGGLDTRVKAADVLSLKSSLGQVGNSAINQGTAVLGSLILGGEAVAGTKLFRFAPKALQGGLNFGTSAGVLMDPDSQRLTSSLQQLGVHSEFTDWLGADPKDAGPLENRFKNALENAGIGTAFDMTFQGAKYLRSVIKGAPDDAAKAAALDAAKKVVPEGAHPVDTPVEVAQNGPATEVKLNGETITAIPTEQFDGLVSQATKRGNPEGLDTSTEPGGSGEPNGGPGEAGPGNADPAQGAPLPGLGTQDSVAPLLRALAIKLHDTPHVVRSDADLMAHAANEAAAVGVSPEDMLAYAQTVAGRLTDIDTAATATRTLWQKIAKDLDGFATKGFDAIDPADHPQLKGAIHNAISFSGSFQDIRSGLGRGLRSLQLPDAKAYIEGKGGKVPAMDALRDGRPVPPLPETPQELRDWLSVWNDLKSDPASQQNFLQSTLKLPSQMMYLRTSFANLFTANALAGLPSLSMNAVSPAIIGPLHTLEKTAGGFLNSMNPLLTQAERAANMAVAKNAARAYVQTIGDIPDAFRFAVQAVENNHSVLGGGGTVDAARLGPITDAMARAASGKDGPIWGYQLGNLINWWPRNFGRINAGLDEFAKRLSYMGEVRLQALVEAETKGIAPELRSGFVKGAMNNSIDEVGAATDETALRTAERTTFTGALAGNEYHPLVGKASDMIQAMRSQFPESRYLLTVFNVPANGVGETMRRLPIVNFLMGETRAELSGELGSIRQADAYGRTLLGAAFLMWAQHAARQGTLTGPGPNDPSAMKAWTQAGHQPYSVRVGDNWVNYSRYDLPGTLLGIPAAMYDATVYRPQDKQDYEAATMAAVGALAQYFKDKSSLQTAAAFLNIGNSTAQDQSFVERTLNSAATRMVIPNFVTQLGRNTMDPTKRSQSTIGESLMNAIPWTSQQLEPMRNVLGEPLHIPRDSLLENVVPITITPAATFKKDPVIAELSRLYEATGVAAGVTSHSEFDGGYYDSRQVKLEDGKSLYDHLVGARQDLTPPGGGPTLRQALSDLFSSEEYKQAKDADASNLVGSDGSYSRGAVVTKLFSEYNNAAKTTVAAQSPIARRWLAITAAKKTDDARLRAYPADDLANNPPLLKALGIDIQQYEQKVSGQ